MSSDFSNDREIKGNEIIIPSSFQTLREFEIWLHNQICERDDVTLGEVFGIFSVDKQYIDKIIIPLSVRRNDPKGNSIEIEISHDLTPGEIDLIRGNIVSHNHPSNLSFSFREILWASDLGVIESRIVTNHWIYLIRPPNQGWPSVDTIERIDIEIDNDVSLDYCITQPNSNPEWLHMRYEVLSRRSGFHYFRDKYS